MRPERGFRRIGLFNLFYRLRFTHIRGAKKAPPERGFQVSRLREEAGLHHAAHASHAAHTAHTAHVAATGGGLVFLGKFGH